jgi:peptide/nickel transport system permease protein
MSTATPVRAGATAAAPGFFARAMRHPSFRIGAVLAGLVVLVALVSMAWTPYSPLDIDVSNKLAEPSAEHWFGQDSLGRDVLSLDMAGAQNSLLVGIIAVGVGLTFGTLLGAVAASEGGWVEELVMRFSDLTFAFPAILSAIMLTAVFGPGISISVVAIGIFNIPIFARITQASAKAAWARDYAAAARAAGRGRVRITIDHILPNILSALVVQGTIQFANAILWEALLAYLGFGTQPPHPSWGRMLNDAQAHLFDTPWLAVFPGVSIMIAVLGLNLLGDGLRDLLDPRLARSR